VEEDRTIEESLLDELRTMRILARILEVYSGRSWWEWEFVARLITFWEKLGYDIVARRFFKDVDTINGAPAPVPTDFAIESAILAQEYVIKVCVDHFEPETAHKLENIVRDAVIGYYGTELLVEEGVLSDKLERVLYDLANGERVPSDEEIVEALEDELVKRVEEKLS